MRIWVDDNCDGFARCVELAPEVFSTPEEPHFRTVVMRPVVDDEAEEDLQSRVIAAIQRCPKRAIHTDLDITY